MVARVLLPAFLICLLAHPSAAVAAQGWTWPVEGEVVRAYRNGADPYARGQHRGIDISAPDGASVVAAAAGSVRFAGTAGSSGLTVSVRTADDRFDASYLHLGSLAVARGQRVRAGEVLGRVGTSGRRSSSGPHLHFGVRRAGSRHAYLNPLDLLPPPPRVRQPRPAPPVAVPVRVPVRTAPAPVATRAPARVPVRAPSPRRVRLPAGRRVRPPLPGRAPGPAPAGAPSTAPLGAPAASRAGQAERPEGRAPEAARGPAGAAAPAGAYSPGTRAEPSRGTVGGPDVGWALACLGLLLAAACAGGTLGGGPARRPRPRGVRSLLRALPGR